MEGSMVSPAPTGNQRQGLAPTGVSPAPTGNQRQGLAPTGVMPIQTTDGESFNLREHEYIYMQTINNMAKGCDNAHVEPILLQCNSQEMKNILVYLNDPVFRTHIDDFNKLSEKSVSPDQKSSDLARLCRKDRNAKRLKNTTDEDEQFIRLFKQLSPEEISYFMKIDVDATFELIKAANFLDIPVLVDACSCRCADLLHRQFTDQPLYY